MATWLIVLISIVSALAVAAIVGLIIGKVLAKRDRYGRKRFLSLRERIIYASCLALGTACILIGLFVKLPGGQTQDMPPDGMGTFDDGGVIGGKEPAGDIAADEAVAEEAAEDVPEVAVAVLG